MQTLKQEYRQFLGANFKGLRIRKSLFYNWVIGLRFDLQVGSTDTDEYFQEVIRRASIVFESIFNSSDEVYVVFMDYKYKRRKIKLLNYVFNQIVNPEFSLCYLIERGLYEPNDKSDKRNVAIIKTTVKEINYKNILTAISHTDFPPRQPRLDQQGWLTSKEVYFININKKIIFNMYDDRGLDIVANNKEDIRPVYIKHNEWLLDYDRERIDKEFKGGNTVKTDLSS